MMARPEHSAPKHAFDASPVSPAAGYRAPPPERHWRSALAAGLVMLSLSLNVSPGHALAQSPPQTPEPAAKIEPAAPKTSEQAKDGDGGELLVLKEFVEEEERRLRECLAKVEAKPEEGYEDALQWQSEGRRPLARECVAAAHVALGRFERGAGDYLALSAAPEVGLDSERARYLALSGNAFRLAGEWEEMKLAFTRAITLAPASASLKLDRAFALEKLGDWEAAKTDLDLVLAAAPRQSEALTLRARANLATGALADAARDIDAALSIAPNDVDSLVLRAEIRQARAKFTAPAKKP